MAAHRRPAALGVVLDERPHLTAREKLHLIVERAVVLEGGMQDDNVWVVQFVQSLRE
jgi:hypothetical protein